MSKKRRQLRLVSNDPQRSHGAPTCVEHSRIEVPQNEGPQIQGSESGSHELTGPSGFFMLAHRAFVDPRLQALPGDCFRVFLWMSSQAYRFKESTGTVRASVRYVSAVAGVSESSVTRVFEKLLRAELIRRVELNYKLGNVWWVNPVAFGGGGGPKATKSPADHSIRTDLPHPEVPQFEGTQTEVEVPPESGCSSLKLGAEVPQKEGNSNNLQDPKIPDSLSSYFLGLKPERKRQSEWKAFESLRLDYSADDIAKALAELQRQDPEGTQYHSPMAYLSQAIAQVLTRLKREAQAVEKSAHARARQDEARHSEAATEREWLKKEAAFLAAFPDPNERKIVISHYAKLPKTVSAFTGQALAKNIAISNWWQEKHAKLILLTAESKGIE